MGEEVQSSKTKPHLSPLLNKERKGEVKRGRL
jgi:hypothetical protein